jgi:biopolymer transport protein TolQ
MSQTNAADAAAQAVAIKLDPVSLVLHASGPVFFVVWSLIAAAAVVWVITVLKLLQLARLSAAERRFEAETAPVVTADHLYALARQHPGAPGARVVLALSKRQGTGKLLEAVAHRAIVDEQKRAGSLMPTLSSIASAGPFVGLFGTVYGIMDAFLRIGQQKSASLPVVAPAIGEALIATAIGLFAAIPATVAYNAIHKRIEDLLAELEASAEAWVAIADQVPAEAARAIPNQPQAPGNRPQAPRAAY